MKVLLYIFIGGGIGSSLRYVCARWVNGLALSHWGDQGHLETGTIFPWGTWVVNTIGCLLIGLLYGICPKHLFSQEVLLLFTAGFCGGFTTFSAFSNEMFLLLRNGFYLSFLAYTLGSILTGLLAVAAGYWLTRQF